MSKDPNNHGRDIYDRRAKSYDKESSIMERMLGSVRKIFGKLHGNILEIGTGTGINLSYYNAQTKVTAIDWSQEMVKIAKNKINRLHLAQIVKIEQGDAQNLSETYERNSFDNITSSCVFCSVPDPIKGLGEVKKVLRKTGRLIQIEHGLSRFWLINIIMRFFDPIIYRFTGTHIARNHFQNLMQAGFQINRIFSLDPMGIMNLIISKPL